MNDDVPDTLDTRTLARNIESLKLTKKDIRLILKALKKRWAKNYFANAKLIAIATAIQGGLLVADDEDIETVWTEVLKGLNKLIILNGTTGAERPDLELLRDNLIRDIEAGNL